MRMTSDDIAVVKNKYMYITRMSANSENVTKNLQSVVIVTGMDQRAVPG